MHKGTRLVITHPPQQIAKWPSVSANPQDLDQNEPGSRSHRRQGRACPQIPEGLLLIRGADAN